MCLRRSIAFSRARFLYAAVLVLLGVSAWPPLHAVAQQPQAITAAGFITDPDGTRIPLSLTFRPAGGAVSGTVDYHYARTFGEFNCDGSVSLVLDGMFAGGDAGAASGTADGTIQFSCDDGSFSRADYQARWSGTFLATGAASGLWSWTREPVDDPDETASGLSTWSVSYSPAVFGAAVDSTITQAYLYAAYGVRVIDSPSKDDDPSSWTLSELRLLNDVLKELPAQVVEKMASSVTFIRSQAAAAGQGSENTSRLATYLSCDLEISPSCKPPSASIRIFDQAHVPFDFANDPDGDMQFKATIVHEMTHALQGERQTTPASARTPHAEATLPSASLLDDWIAATRTVTVTSDPNYWSDQNGWQLMPDTWIFFDVRGNQLPTDYAATGPSEDLAESVMLYVFDPTRLMNRSSARYAFIRDRIFGGLEYVGSAPQAITIVRPDASLVPSNPRARR